MLFLLFQLDDKRFALDAARIAEVLPLVDIERPLAPAPGMAGLLRYRGQLLPVVDLPLLLLRRPAARRLSTRILLLDGVLGVIAERATGTIRLAEGDFATPSRAAETTPCLGRMAMTGDGPIQEVDVDRLLAEMGPRAPAAVA
jgi:chemotaxis-related protein WspB